MKKVLLTLALAAGIASAQAQTNTIGIKAAYGITSLSGSSKDFTSVSHAAYQAGLMGDLFVADVVSIHPELLYTKQYFDATDLAKKSRDIDYLNLPVTVRYHADGLYFEAGPEVNFALTAVDEEKKDVKSRDVTPVVLNYVVGLGYELKSGLSANIRYDGGISHTYKISAEDHLGEGNLRASTFWFGLGYAFGGSK